MKRLCIILSFFLCSTVYSQQAHQKADIVLSPGISFGNYLRNTNDYVAPLSMYADFGMHDYFSAGPYTGIVIADQGLGLGFGGRANFHFWNLTDRHAHVDLRSDILDVYLTFFMGFEIGKNYSDHFRGGLSAGLRYYPTERFGMFFEFGGTPMGYATLGANIKVFKK